MQQYRERSLIKGLQVCCLKVVTHRDSDSENSPSQTQKLSTYRNKIASEALVSCNCSMLPSNQTCTHYFFPLPCIHYSFFYSKLLPHPHFSQHVPFTLSHSLLLFSKVAEGDVFLIHTVWIEGTERAKGFFFFSLIQRQIPQKPQNPRTVLL